MSRVQDDAARCCEDSKQTRLGKGFTDRIGFSPNPSPRPRGPWPRLPTHGAQGGSDERPDHRHQRRARREESRVTWLPQIAEATDSEGSRSFPANRRPSGCFAARRSNPKLAREPLLLARRGRRQHGVHSRARATRNIFARAIRSAPCVCWKRFRPATRPNRRNSPPAGNGWKDFLDAKVRAELESGAQTLKSKSTPNTSACCAWSAPAARRPCRTDGECDG